MANSPPSIKDNPFKRLDALRNKVSGVKAPAPAAAAPPVPARRPIVIRHTTDGDWCEVTDCSTGKRGRVPSSAIQEVKETTGAAAPTTAPEKKKGYTYSSLPSLTGGPKRKIFKQPKRR